MSVKTADIQDALSQIKDPKGETDVFSAGRIQGIHVKDGTVRFAVTVHPGEGPEMEEVRQACEAAVKKLKGIEKVTAVLTAERQPGQDDQGGQSSDSRIKTTSSRENAAEPPSPKPDVKGNGLKGVKQIIAVASGKGGVGKSTTAVNLALALKALGLKVGLLDTDVYGPSIPRMMGLSGKPDSDGQMVTPMEGYGVPTMSIGFMVDEETAMIWRGPMVVSAIQQMLNDVAWGELDVLVLDLPPGTGDAQLTIAQRVPLTGAVIVSTPQDIALLDARRGIGMFDRVKVPTLGIIENMSTFICPHCGEESHIFGHGGAEEEAAKRGVDFLGGIPLDIRIRETSDSGAPIVATEPDSAQAKAYIEVADRLIMKLSAVAGARPAPKIRFSD